MADGMKTAHYRELKSCINCISSKCKSGGYYHPGGQYQDMSYLKCTNETSGKIRVTEHGICDKWLGVRKK